MRPHGILMNIGENKNGKAGSLNYHRTFRSWSLGVLSGLEEMMYTRDTSKPAGSEARGDGRERGNLIEATSKPLVAQRAGGIFFQIVGGFAQTAAARCKL